ncbi:hypothetical protein [Porphyrobacter sp. GA68]|uniref:hypothetical protein n=1 Tax=Porphyrobacter sp. GA68 TaxID=2883480 RepID=UPI001D186DB0|nr:hypothetical protein [Porphyrobacter sp. GA68]
MHLLRSVATCVAAAFVAVPALAQDNVALTSEVHVVRVVDGKEQLDPPASVLPGDRLVFTTRYRNAGSVSVDNFVVTNPLPAPVVLASDGAFAVSVDGGRTFGPLAEQRITEDGAARAATTADVTHVRWNLPSIAPGAGGELSYFATVR